MQIIIVMARIIRYTRKYRERTDGESCGGEGSGAPLITRPRRFGKTLTMSRLEQFFSVAYAGEAVYLKGSPSGRMRRTGRSRALVRCSAYPLPGWKEANRCGLDI